MDEMNEVDEMDLTLELTEQEKIERCGTKLTKKKVEEICEQFKENVGKRFLIDGTPDIGCVVNGYKIVGYLGTGGFGSVCLASKGEWYFAMKFIHVDTEHKCPSNEFKVLNALLKSDQYDKFLTAIEWNTWKDLQDFYGNLGLKDWRSKLCYMVMKLAGPSLQMLVEQQENHVFPINQGIRIMMNALNALRLFHERKLVHHDIKLENFALDLTNENQILLLDYGMGKRAPRKNKDKNGFKGTRLYASRRALKRMTQSYRDDCESWLYCLYRFLFRGLLKVHISNPLKQKNMFWAPGTVENRHIIKIMKNIDLLGFNETMNFSFVQQCLQDLMDESNEIPNVPYLYRMSGKGCLQIVKGNFIFNAKSPEIKKPRIPLVCNHSSCDFTIYVETAEYQKAKEDEEAIIIDYKNQHNCSTI